jgi:hypothetical protein
LIRGLGVQESGQDPDPYQEKYAFLSITSVLGDQIGHVRACWKGRSAQMNFSWIKMVTCACGLLPNPARIPVFQNKA